MRTLMAATNITYHVAWSPLAGSMKAHADGLVDQAVTAL
jgi:hypothetical protein